MRVRKLLGPQDLEYAFAVPRARLGLAHVGHDDDRAAIDQAMPRDRIPAEHPATTADEFVELAERTRIAEHFYALPAGVLAAFVEPGDGALARTPLNGLL